MCVDLLSPHHMKVNVIKVNQQKGELPEFTDVYTC